MRSHIKIRQTVATMLTVLLLFSILPIEDTGRSLASTLDVEGHWAQEEIQAWLDKGFITGYEGGSFRPSQAITRAEWIALINRVFSFENEQEIHFSDVPATAWYAQDVSVALAAGYIGGYADGRLQPSAPITRQEAAVVLSRIGSALLTESGKEAVEHPFKDSLAAWSEASVIAVAEIGWMQGYPDGTFAPQKPFTRAEAILTLTRFTSNVLGEQSLGLSHIYDQAGTFGPSLGQSVVHGDVVIETAGVVLQNLRITGSLSIAEAVGAGSVTLRGVTVEGETIVKGGGKDSIHVTDSQLQELTIRKQGEAVRIVVSGNTTIGEATVYSSTILEEEQLSGQGFTSVNAAQEISKESKVMLSGEFDKVFIAGSHIRLELLKGSIKELIVSKRAQGVSIYLARGTTVEEATLHAGVRVTGPGVIKKGRMESPVNGNEDFQPAPNPGSPAPEPTPSVTGYVYTPDSISFTSLNSERQLTLTEKWSDGSSKDVTNEALWSSEDEQIAAVNEQGLVTSKGEGTTFIHVTYGDFTARIEANVMVIPDPYSVSIQRYLYRETGEPNVITFTALNMDGSTALHFNGVKTISISGLSRAPDGSIGSWDGEPFSDTSVQFEVRFTNGVGEGELVLHRATLQELMFEIEGVVQSATLHIGASAVAKQLHIETQPSAHAVSDIRFDVQPVVHITDNFGNLVGSHSTNVKVEVAEGSAILIGGSTVLTVWGKAIFNDLGLSGEEQHVVLRFTAEGLREATSQPITVVQPPAEHPFDRGSGTPSDPYVIKTAEQLDSVRDYLDASFVLEKDIDLSSEAYRTGGGWQPIGVLGDEFTGNFDGQGYTIHNLFINRPDAQQQALFGATANQASIQNLLLDGVNVTGSFNTGSLIGFMRGGTVSNVHTKGNVTGNGGYTGGLLGRTGLGTTVNQSSSNIALTSENSLAAGGLVGSNEGDINESFTVGFCTANHINLGGLVGYNLGKIENSYSSTHVEGGSGNVGGLVGDNSGVVIHSYFSGLMDTSPPEGDIQKGGLIGHNTGTVTASYYDKDISGMVDTGKGDPQTTADMKKRETFPNWDFDSIWAIEQDTGYPYLQWQDN